MILLFTNSPFCSYGSSSILYHIQFLVYLLALLCSCPEKVAINFFFGLPLKWELFSPFRKIVPRQGICILKIWLHLRNINKGVVVVYLPAKVRFFVFRDFNLLRVKGGNFNLLRQFKNCSRSICEDNNKKFLDKWNCIVLLVLTSRGFYPPGNIGL